MQSDRRQPELCRPWPAQQSSLQKQDAARLFAKATRRFAFLHRWREHGPFRSGGFRRRAWRGWIWLSVCLKSWLRGNQSRRQSSPSRRPLKLDFRVDRWRAAWDFSSEEWRALLDSCLTEGWFHNPRLKIVRLPEKLFETQTLWRLFESHQISPLSTGRNHSISPVPTCGAESNLQRRPRWEQRCSAETRSSWQETRTKGTEGCPRRRRKQLWFGLRTCLRSDRRGKRQSCLKETNKEWRRWWRLDDDWTRIRRLEEWQWQSFCRFHMPSQRICVLILRCKKLQSSACDCRLGSQLLRREGIAMLP